MSASLGKPFQLGIREAVAAPKRVTTDLGPGGRNVDAKVRKASTPQLTHLSTYRLVGFAFTSESYHSYRSRGILPTWVLVTSYCDQSLLMFICASYVEHMS
jgi:hypothetical protein